MQAHELLHFPPDKMLAENGSDILINQSFMYLLGVIGGAEGLYRQYNAKPDPKQAYYEDSVYLAKIEHPKYLRQTEFCFARPDYYHSTFVWFDPLDEEVHFSFKWWHGERIIKEHFELTFFEKEGNVLVFEPDGDLMKRIMGEFYDDTLPLPQFKIEKNHGEYLLKICHWYGDVIKEGRYRYAPCRL